MLLKVKLQADNYHFLERKNCKVLTMFILSICSTLLLFSLLYAFFSQQTYFLSSGSGSVLPSNDPLAQYQKFSALFASKILNFNADTLKERQTFIDFYSRDDLFDETEGYILNRLKQGRTLGVLNHSFVDSEANYQLTEEGNFRIVYRGVSTLIDLNGNPQFQQPIQMELICTTLITEAGFKRILISSIRIREVKP